MMVLKNTLVLVNLEQKLKQYLEGEMEFLISNKKE